MTWNSHDFIFGTKTKLEISDPSHKVPINKGHYPFAPDEEHQGKIPQNEWQVPSREGKLQPDRKNVDKVVPVENLYTKPLGIDWNLVMKPHHMNEIFKVSNGHQTIYVPNHYDKRLAFEPEDPARYRNDKIVEKNEYDLDAFFADSEAEFPPWVQDMTDIVNVTPERIEEFSK